MGDVARMNQADRLEKRLKEKIDKEAIVIGISGGVPYLIKNDTEARILVVDADNAEDLNLENCPDGEIEDSGSVGYL